MVFIKRTRHTMRILVQASDARVCSRAKEATVVPVVTIDGHKLGEVTEQLSVVDQQLNLVVVIRVHGDDASAGLTIGFEEAALAIVDDSVSNDGALHVVQRAIAVRRAGLARGVAWHRAWHRRVVEKEN
jgi:hypothetical protein